MPSSKNNSYSYTTYLSPFTTRYGSDGMRKIWSEEHKRLLWRKIWVALAKAQHKAGLISQEELADIAAHQQDIAIAASRKREEKVYHELMSEIQIFSEQCKIGGGKIHLGATSTDILDNATSMQVHEAFTLVKTSLVRLLALFAKKIQEYEDVVCIGYTHLQPAEPTTLSYRLAFYAQDLLLDLQLLEKMQPFLKGKGLKGAVGTSASFAALLTESQTTPDLLEKDFLKELGMQAVDITNQTYPRKLDLLVMEIVSNIAASLHKFCFDYRILQSPLYGEWMEKRNQDRVGSSAMPFKRNPDRAEKICSLCRYISGLLIPAWNNPAHSLLERTLDDSASQRLFLPEAFLALDDCLAHTYILLERLEINMHAVKKNLSDFGQFAATEPLLMQLVKRGANRQIMHEVIKSCSMKAWQGREEGKTLSLFTLLGKEREILRYMSPKELALFASPAAHIGMAKKRTQAFLKLLQKSL